MTPAGEETTIESNIDRLVQELRRAGLSDQVIQAAWPSWWSDELGSDPSGRAELRFALSRRLGLSPKSLLGERVEFIWQDEALFKHVTSEDAAQLAALTSFGVSIGRLLVQATPTASPLDNVGALRLRKAILADRPFVDLQGLLAACWAFGIPVVHLRVFPLEKKGMHAMVVRIGDRYAILLGRNSNYPAPVAFTLAHELGHVLLGHLNGYPALADLKDPATAVATDDQEYEADHFGLTLLTSQPDPVIKTSIPKFNAPTLARAVIQAAPQYKIEPGTLALILAHSQGAWPVAMSALKFIYDSPRPVWSEVNGLANVQLSWNEIPTDAVDYVRSVMGLHG